MSARHPWRQLKFDELAEMYTSMSIRSLGFGIIGIFVPIFLYKSGVSLQSIFLFYTVFFIMRIPVAYVSAFIVGRIGPKHAIAISTILLITFLLMLLGLDAFSWPLSVLAFWFTVSNGLFFVAYDTDFSKIKSTKHGGKELGWLYIFERAGAALGPLVGGVLASFISPELTITVAVLVLIGSLFPLLASNEPVKLNQKITFKGFKWRRHSSDYIALSAFAIDNVGSAVFWPLLLAVFIFTDDSYAKIGALTGFAMLVSMFSARMFGKFIDNKKGLPLLNFGTVINAITHVIRAFTTSAGGAVAVSILNEPVTLSYRMPLMKGFFDEADNEPGYRIVYVTSTEMVTAVTKALYCLALFVACNYYDSISVLRYSYVVVAVISLGILLQKFPALKKV